MNVGTMKLFIKRDDIWACDDDEGILILEIKN
jgi:hypothetical protein